MITFQAVERMCRCWYSTNLMLLEKLLQETRLFEELTDGVHGIGRCLRGEAHHVGNRCQHLFVFCVQDADLVGESSTASRENVTVNSKAR